VSIQAKHLKRVAPIRCNAMQNKVAAVYHTSCRARGYDLPDHRVPIWSVTYALRLPRYPNCLAEQNLTPSVHPSRRREPQPVHELHNGIAARCTGAVREPVVACGNYVPQTTEQQQHQQATVAEVKGSHHHQQQQPEEASSDGGGNNPGVPATAARGE
jgi:hypothetical protein